MVNLWWYPFIVPSWLGLDWENSHSLNCALVFVGTLIAGAVVITPVGILFRFILDWYFFRQDARLATENR
jgi:hypothetical protein